MSLFFAIFVTLCTILVLICSMFFGGKMLAVLFGVCAFLGMLSTTISAYYQQSSMDALGRMNSTSISQSFSYGEGEWSYSEEDWGVFFDKCSNYSIHSEEFKKCLTNEFVPKALEYIDFQWKYRFIGIGVSCLLVLFLINPKPLTTGLTALVLALITSVWALPIYTTAVYLRSPDKYTVRAYCTENSLYWCILGFGWSMPFCLIIIGLFIPCACITGIVIFSLFLVVGCFGVVIPILQLGHTDCAIYALGYRENMIRTSIPQFIVVGLIGIYLIATIISCLCGEPAAPVKVVRVIVIVDD